MPERQQQQPGTPDPPNRLGETGSRHRPPWALAGTPTTLSRTGVWPAPELVVTLRLALRRPWPALNRDLPAESRPTRTVVVEPAPKTKALTPSVLARGCLRALRVRTSREVSITRPPHRPEPPLRRRTVTRPSARTASCELTSCALQRPPAGLAAGPKSSTP